MAIDAISSSALGSISGLAAPPAPAAAGFGDALTKLLAAVDSSAGEANAAVSNMAQGTGDVHEAMIALQRSEMTLQLTVQVRNKLVQAYQDVMRMAI